MATASAIVASAGLLSAAAASALAGRVVLRVDRDLALRVILIVGLAGLAGLFAVAVAPQRAWLLVLRILIGATFGLAMTFAYSTVANETPFTRQGLGLATIGSGSAYGSSLGLLLAGLLETVWLPLVFVANSILLAAAAVTHWLTRRNHGRPSPRGRRAGPPTSWLDGGSGLVQTTGIQSVDR